MSVGRFSPTEREICRLAFDLDTVNDTPNTYVAQTEDIMSVACSDENDAFDDDEDSDVVAPRNKQGVAPPEKRKKMDFERDDVGRRIEVHWNTRESYDGIIGAFNVNNGQVHVAYDDGDEEWLDPLDKETSWEFLGPPERKTHSPWFDEYGVEDEEDEEEHGFEDEEDEEEEKLRRKRGEPKTIEGVKRRKQGNIIRTLRTCGIAGCKYKTGYQNNMNRHKAARHSVNLIWYHCDQDGCDFKAKQSHGIKTHKQQVHDIDVQWHPCDQDGCDYKAKRAGHLKRHKADIHDIDVHWHYCDQDGCDYKAKQSFILKEHKQNAHDIDVRWHHCDQDGCDFKAKQSGTLKRHKQNVHDLDVQWHQCSIKRCRYKTKRTGNLKKHIWNIHKKK